MMGSKPKVGILTTFTGSDQAYSLVNVVSTQLSMLRSGGYQPILFAREGFEGTGPFDPSRVDLRLLGSPSELWEASRDIQVMLCHDITFLSQNREWGDEIRKIAASRDNIAWVHWQHSRGDHSPVDLMAHSYYAYPNQGDLLHVAQINSSQVDRVSYVPHPLDFGYLGYPKLAIRIAEDYKYPFADIRGILPTRMDRQKQVEKAVRLFAGLKRAGNTVCFLVADAYATGPNFKEYKKEVVKIAREQGLTEEEFVFLGDTYKECTYSTPRPVVKALLEMGNLFIQPSNSETSSLVAMEAALAGNLLVINSDFPPIKDLYNKALSFPFGSVLEDTKYYKHVKLADGTETKVEDPQTFWDDQARLVVTPVLKAQLTLAVKSQQFYDRWPSKVFKEYMEPLILKAFEEVKAAQVRLPDPGDPEVTAIITTLDNLPLLERQIDVLSGEVGKIIVVNNGSKDGTQEWLKSVELPKLSFINRKNKGAGPGRNAGLNLWDNSTPYVLMVDGGILPPIGGVRLMKDFLSRHLDIEVISPEVATCFTTEEDEATLIVRDPIPDQTFAQRCLSSTAFALCRASAWKVRFSEEGPFAEPGWGVDDNYMAYDWDNAGVVHHDFTHETSKWLLYRRASGSFKRLFEETGIYPNQYGSVYEARNVKSLQDHWQYHRMLLGLTQVPTVSYTIEDVGMPEFAKLVKKLHTQDKNCEIIGNGKLPLESIWWLDTFALRFPWGDTALDPEGKILSRGATYPEELWSGDVIRNRGPVGEKMVIINKENLDEYLETTS